MLFRIYQKTGYLKNHYYSTMNKMFAANNDAAPYFLALDWILHSGKGCQDDYTVVRGYELLSNLAENGNWLANSYYDGKGCHENTNGMYRETCGHDLWETVFQSDTFFIFYIVAMGCSKWQGKRACECASFI